MCVPISNLYFDIKIIVRYSSSWAALYVLIMRKNPRYNKHGYVVLHTIIKASVLI